MKATGMGTSNDQRGKAIRAGRGGSVAVGFAFLAIVLMACGLRLLLYGDPRLAVATIDTQSYLDSSRAPLLSAESFSGRRLFTTNMLYKAMSGGADCSPRATSMPGVGTEASSERV